MDAVIESQAATMTERAGRSSKGVPAAAVVAAWRKIVEGAVGMVRDAVTQLAQGSSDDDAIALDPDRRATFAANLMTVIASDAPTSPVVNVGTLTR